MQSTTGPHFALKAACVVSLTTISLRSTSLPFHILCYMIWIIFLRKNCQGNFAAYGELKFLRRLENQGAFMFRYSVDRAAAILDISPIRCAPIWTKSERMIPTWCREEKDHEVQWEAVLATS